MLIKFDSVQFNIEEKSIPRKNVTRTVTHYRNVFGPIEEFIKRTIDYTKIKVSQEIYRSEVERLKSLDSFPLNDGNLKIRIARTGMYYIGAGRTDDVKCIYCQGVLSNWKVTDSARLRHRMMFPTCPFVIGLDVSNSSMMITGRDPDIDEVKSEKVDITIVSNKLSDEIVDELFCYNKLWLSNYSNNKYKLIENDFLYIVQRGYDSYVKCYKCLKEVYYCKGKFDLIDKSFFHHIDCDYHRMNMYDSLSKSIYSKAEMCEIQYSVTDLEIDARMDTPLVRQVLEMEHNFQDIKRLIRKKLRNEGQDYSSKYELICDLKQINEILANEDPNVLSATFENFAFGYQCVICLTNSVNMLFLPCGHMKTCDECSVDLTTCPFCRRIIDRRVTKIRLRETIKE